MHLNPFLQTLLLIFLSISWPGHAADPKNGCNDSNTISQSDRSLTALWRNSLRHLAQAKMNIVGQAGKFFQETVVENAAADLSHQSIALKVKNKDKNIRTIHLSLGDRKGGGVFGNVYVVEEISDASLTGMPAGVPMVVKMPHALKGTSTIIGAPFFTKSAIRRETQASDLVLQQMAKVESSSLLPSNPSWKKGQLPLIPTTAQLESDYGPLLFKPLLSKAKFLKNIDQLTPEMIVSLRKIYDFAQAVGDQVKIKNGKTLRSFRMDLRPPNLAWIEDPEMLARFGYKEPGWILFEIDDLPPSVPHTYLHSEGMSFDDYLHEFQSYLGK